jgi:hypothetical protein
MASVAYLPFFRQSSVKHPRSLELITVAIIGYTYVLQVLSSSLGLSSSRSASYDRALAYFKASSPKRAI